MGQDGVLSESELPMRLNLSDVAASSAHVPPSSGSRTRKVPSLDRAKELLRNRAETRGLLRLPVRAERPRDVFNLTVLSVRLVPGRRILSNAIPANGLSAPTSDRAEDAECNAPPNGVLVGAPPAATSLKLTPMGSCRTAAEQRPPERTFNWATGC
jgi:hypothetical protein